MRTLPGAARFFLPALAWLAWHAATAGAAGPEERFPQVVRVGASHDNQPFEYRIESRVEKDRYTVLRMTYPSPVVTAVPQNNTIPAEYYLPRGLRSGEAKRPAVIFLHILDGNMEMVRMTCSVLASHGIPAILFKLPYYGERGLPEGPEAMARDARLFVAAVSQAFADVRRTVDVLASRPEVDPGRIGIAGVSLGGIVAATAAEMDPRIHRALLILAGGDLVAIIHHARETRELSELIRRLSPDEKAQVENALADVDPLRRADRLRQRARQGKVRMINAAEDEVIPRACTEKLADGLGMTGRVHWLDGLGHYTALAALPQILASMVEFFAEDLPPGVKPPAPAAPRRTPVAMVLGLGQQAISFFTKEPAEGRCHFADLEVVVRPEGDNPIEGRLRYLRGPGYTFRLEVKAPVVGDVAIGQGAFPWMASGGKAVFQGSALPQAGKGPRQPSSPLPQAGEGPGVRVPSPRTTDPLAFADPKYLMRLKVAAGAVGGAVLAPDILEPLATITEERSIQPGPAVRIQLKGRNQGEFLLRFKEDRTTPASLDFDVPGAKGTVTFRVWQMDTIARPELFEPPAGVPAKHVDSVELYRIFSAMFNFAMEQFE
ncbi:MAG: alpha/beta hydrolase [Thermoguttaceae bacterium]|jgi:dienelactone hydrolase|nr:alpha/beta hydrolase [Thermoguttaceae bacterium]